MEVLNKTSSGLKRSYNILISPEEIEAATELKLQEAAKTVKVNGFRQGKVPINVVRRLYGTSVRPEAISSLIGELSKKVIADEKLRIALNFTNSIVKEDEKGLEFTLKCEVLPEIKEPDYKSIELTKHIPEITEDEVKEILDDLKSNHTNWVDEPESTEAKIGNKVTVDLVFGTNQKSNKRQEINGLEIVIGDEDVMPDVWKPFEGAKAGDVLDFVVNYPENIEDKSLAGKSLNYHASVKKVQRVEAYTDNEVFAKDLGFESFEKLHAWAVSRATANYEAIARDILKRDLLEKISGLCDFEVPENLYRVEYNEVERQIRTEAKNMGREMTDKVIDGCKKLTKDRVQLGFIISEIAKREKITVSSDEVVQAIRNLVKLYPGREKQIWDLYSKGEAVNIIVGPILENKVVDFLLGIVKIKEDKCHVSELIALDEEEFDFFKKTDPESAAPKAPKKASIKKNAEDKSKKADGQPKKAEAESKKAEAESKKAEAESKKAEDGKAEEKKTKKSESEASDEKKSAAKSNAKHDKKSSKTSETAPKKPRKKTDTE